MMAVALVWKGGCRLLTTQSWMDSNCDCCSQGIDCPRVAFAPSVGERKLEYVLLTDAGWRQLPRWCYFESSIRVIIVAQACIEMSKASRLHGSHVDHNSKP